MGRRPKIIQPAAPVRNVPEIETGEVDIKTAAELLDVSTKTIRRYIQAGQIKADKIRNVWLIPADEVERLRGLTRDESGPVPVEMRAFMDTAAERLSGIESGLNRLLGPLQQELEESRARLAQLEEDNQMLREEIASLKQQVQKTRAENTAVPQAAKHRAEEIDALRASIISNERGLALLREEVTARDEVIREKESEILQLLDKLKEMETLHKTDPQRPRKPRFWDGIIKSGAADADRS